MPRDIADIRENPEKVREETQKRFCDVAIVDEAIELDTKWRVARGELDDLNKEMGALKKQIGALFKQKKREEAAPIVAKNKELQKQLPALQKVEAELAERRETVYKKVPNTLHESVPVSNDEEENEITATWGDIKEDALNEMHHQLLWRIGGYEPERGVKAAGHRAYYLTGPGLLLNLALINYGTQFTLKKGFTPVQPPYFMNKDVMGGVAQLSQYEEELYKVTGEGGEEKFLIATSEQPICAYHKDEWLAESQLPKLYTGVSTCFRKEAGSHGRDTWGIFRVHQFDKIEQFAVTEPEKSWEMHEQMINTAEEFYKSLGIPYRVVCLVSGELNNAAAKKLDLEGWFPGYGEYRELVSCSNCTDYQSRSMGIRCGVKKAGEAKKYVHMLNATLCATGRTICAILENYQTEEGVVVPEVLRPYLGGTEFFPFVRKAMPNANKTKMQKADMKKAKKAMAETKL
eukprot:TRINITY_DN1641_c0_g1_i3.p1 TRINITY_DN1641_c0_g1~~TRINITY_DN1641_c0_g1_i3.p1  ORF type:complete len:460 (+),score=156.34 TRINITY_DN1641_c0_g1_i3:68-1447(+)